MPQRTQQASHQQRKRGSDVPGFILVDPSGAPVYLNDEAIRILSRYQNFSTARNGKKLLPAEIQQFIRDTKELPNNASTKIIKSGRRKYVCRCFSLSSANAESSWPIWAILLERNGAGRDVLLLCSRYRLTRREQEAVQLLADGLTSKEIADRMGISPNTVKAFLRLVMIKTEVTTRSGIVGKLISA